MAQMRNEFSKVVNASSELKRALNLGSEVWSGLAVYEKYNSVLEYTWRRYSLITNKKYVESYVGASADVSVTSPQGWRSYSLNSSTGIFTIDKFFHPRLGDTRYVASGNTLRKETAINDNGYGTITFNVKNYTSVEQTSYSRGSYIGTVKATTSNAYPTNGASGSYYYDTRTSTYIKGITKHGTIEAEPNSLPSNGRHTDGFWYVLIG